MRLETRMRRGGRPVGQALLLDPRLEQRRVRRLADDDLRIGTLLSKYAADPLQRPAGAIAGHPQVETVTAEVVYDFARRGAGIIFFNDTATTEIYPLSLHDALPIFQALEPG